MNVQKHEIVSISYEIENEILLSKIEFYILSKKKSSITLNLANYYHIFKKTNLQMKKVKHITIYLLKSKHLTVNYHKLMKILFLYRKNLLKYAKIKSTEEEWSMNQAQDPIGVFDSGAGGISTLREMIRELPDERFIYFGDMANAPYGTKNTEEVITCVRSVVDRLMEQSIKALVIACNTATGAAAAVLRDELSIPVEFRVI